jgi:PAS domain S-box-containing protein
MDVKDRPTYLRFAVAIATVLVALLITHLVPWLRQRESLVLFFGAVTLSAWYGGRGPGFLACVLAAVVTNVLIYEPAFTLTLTPEAVIPLLAFMGVASLISSLTTDLARSERQSREHEELLDVTLKSIAEAVICTDGEGRITFINQAAHTLIGHDPKGRGITELFEQEGVKKEVLETLLLRPLRENTTSDLGGLTRLVVSPKRPLIEGAVAPIKDANNQLKGLVIVLRDVTERESTKTRLLDYQERLRSMASQFSLTEERGRRAIATGLHDRVGQSLALTRIKLSTLRDDIGDPKLAGQLDDAVRLLRDVLTEIKTLTFELSPPILYELGLDAAIEWLITSFHQQYNLDCSFERTGSIERKPQQVEIILFQMARELLTNIVKHAPNSHARVKLVSGADTVQLSVGDNGQTANVQESSLGNTGSSGFGLFSIRERIRYLGGAFSLDSSPGRGTCVSVSLPIIVAQPALGPAI